MNIFETIKKAAEGRSAHDAVIEGEDRIGYGLLIASAERTAESMRGMGVGRFHRVGLLCGDSIDHIIASLGILSLGAAVVPIPPDQAPAEVETIVDRIDVDFLVAERELYTRGSAEPMPSGGFLRKRFVIVKRTVRGRPPAGYFDVNPAFIRFSSGTTGASKGVVLSHETIDDRTEAADRGLRITSEDVVIWVLSMSFHFVVSILLFLRRGATIVLCGRRFPDSLVEGIALHGATVIYASPFHFSLLSRSDAVAGDALKGVRLAISTAMKLPDRVAEEFSAKFGIEPAEAYGIIEVGLPFIRLSGGRDKRGSVGKALPDFGVRLDGKDENGVGEILVRGKGLLDAYYSPWRGREEILSEGWFRTGDLGKFDADGFLSIVGRDNDVINFAGMKVFPQEVESVIDLHPRVKESFVYGLPHPRFGELPTAKVVLRDGAGDEALVDGLRRFCYERLAGYQVPKEFLFVDRLDKTASGKIKR
jgi:long-chain acyl-CoA synthetase